MRLEDQLAFNAFVIALHHLRDRSDPAAGVSCSRLVSLFAPGGVGSRAVVKRQLALNRLRGHPVSAPASGRGHRILEPSATLLRTLSHWLHANLYAVQTLVALPAPTALLADDPWLLSEVLSTGVQAYRHQGFVLSEDFPEVRSFMQREHGYLVLMSILESMVPSPDGGHTAAAR